jgi:hypothetical protein
MVAQALLEDNITLKIGNSNKQKKACLKVNQNQNKIEVLLTLKTTFANGHTFISAKKSATFNFEQSSEKFTESLKEQIGRSNSYIEVKYI